MAPVSQFPPLIQRPHVSLAAEKLFGSIVTNSMFTMLLVMIALVIFFAIATRRLRSNDPAALLATPRGTQRAAEWLIEFLHNTVIGTAGKSLGRRVFPLIATIFIFVLLANYAGLLPGVGTIGYCEEVPAEHNARVLNASAASGGAAAVAAEGEISPGCEKHPGTVLVPFLRAPNADFNMTIAMALISITVVQYQAIKAHGLGSYLKEFIAPPIPLLHAIGEFARIISLSARLFGNIFGGEVLLAVIIALTLPVFGVLGVIPAVFYGLELFFGLIQATLFAMLTLIYITVAAAGHGDHDEHHHEPGMVGAVERQAEELAA